MPGTLFLATDTCVVGTTYAELPGFEYPQRFER